MNLQELISKIAGEYPKYSMEHRALNILTFSVAFNCFCGSVLGLFLQMSLDYVLSQTIVSLFVFTFYFVLKKFRNNTYVSTISVFGILLLFFYTFFSEGGINGPTYGIASGFFIIFISLTTHRVYSVIYPMAYMITLVGSLLLNYFYPNLVIGYFNENQRYLDYTINFFQTIIPVYFLFLSNQECYRYEQDQVLQKNKQLSIANTTKEKLFAIIGHDLRSPIASLDSLFLMLNDGRITESEIPHHLLQIQNKTGQIRDLLDHLLYWAVSQMEHLQTHATLLYPQRIAAIELSMLREQANYKNLQVENSISSSATVFADSEQTKIILRNILTNAVKYATTGGFVSVSNKSTEDNQIIIVSNSGKWIEDFADTNISDPKRKGFGLFLSKEFAIKNGGSLEIDTLTTDVVIVQWTVPKSAIK